MSAVAIIGLQWGDEGKGKIVDRLAAEAQHVARFQGGHNAGHTLLINDKKIILHLLPAGVLRDTARCYIGNGVVISPPALLDEIRLLAEDGVDLRGRLFIALHAALILPYHVEIDCAREHKNKIGTTKRGIGPAYEDKVGRRALHFYDVLNGCGEHKLADTVSFYNDLLARHLESPPQLQVAKIWDDLCRQTEQLRPYLCDDIGEQLAQAHRRGDNILLEGAQGSMLDIEQGTYPFTTSSSCLASSAPGGLGVELSPQVLGVIKAYCTRVGNGPFPTELNDADGAILSKRGEEFGATTQRARRCGWLDVPLLRHALRVNGCRRMIVTKLDIFDFFENIKVCVEYDLDGARLQLPPADPAALARCRPVYQTLAGWRGKSVKNVTAAEHLPSAARDYLRRLEEWCDASIDIVSTGAERDAAIINKTPFSE